jgi:geranylgeranyl reductase family protein
MLYLASQMKEASDKFPEWDLVIIGAGPAGAIAALKMVGKGYKVALVDKAVFPRDKICGDALSLDVIQQLPWVSESLAERFKLLERKHPITGGKLIAPNRKSFNINFRNDEGRQGFVVSRIDLDNMFIEEVKSHPEIQLFEGVEIEEIVREGNTIRLKTGTRDFVTHMIIGADGNHSLVAKQLGKRTQIDRNNHCAALRQYYENVSWPDGTKDVELHFIHDVLPGYLWVFPMSHNRANVGIGMLSKAVSKRKINLKKVLEKQLAEHPELAPRFADSKPLETVKGFGIPIGSKKYVLSGNNYLLAGDAACLVDPVSGEGIAMLALNENRMDAEFLKQYDSKIYKLIGDELRFSRFLQRSFRSATVLNILLPLFGNSTYLKRKVYTLFYKNNFW